MKEVESVFTVKHDFDIRDESNLIAFLDFWDYKDFDGSILKIDLLKKYSRQTRSFRLRP